MPSVFQFCFECFPHRLPSMESSCALQSRPPIPRCESLSATECLPQLWPTVTEDGRVDQAPVVGIWCVEMQGMNFPIRRVKPNFFWLDMMVAKPYISFFYWTWMVFGNMSSSKYFMGIPHILVKGEDQLRMKFWGQGLLLPGQTLC